MRVSGIWCYECHECYVFDKQEDRDVENKIDGACLVIRLVGCTGLVCGKPEGLSVSGKGE